MNKTCYIIRRPLPSGEQFVKTWTTEGWSFDPTTDRASAFEFDSMTVALCVWYCLDISPAGWEVIPAFAEQLALPL